MELVAFGIGLSTAGLLAAMYLVSYVRPAYRFWPPGDRDWKFFAHWLVNGLNYASIVALAILDWNGFVFPQPGSLLAGSVLFVIGSVAALLVELALGSDEMVGLEGELRTDGPYRYTRNPQYVALFVATVGFVFLANSAFVTILGVFLLAKWLFLPLPEETWLRSVYGRPYEEYCDAVPRFVGARTARRLLTQ